MNVYVDDMGIDDGDLKFELSGKKAELFKNPFVGVWSQGRILQNIQ